MLVKLDHFPNFRGENKKMKPPAMVSVGVFVASCVDILLIGVNHPLKKQLTNHNKGGL